MRIFRIVPMALLIATLPGGAFAQATTFSAGAARVDVTPAEKELPKNIEGILDRLYSRAIVVDNGVQSAALITVDAGAIPETVPASAGLLVPSGDAAALGAALARFLDEPKLRAQLAAGARAAGARLPDWPHAVAGWAAALDRLLAA